MVEVPIDIMVVVAELPKNGWVKGSPMPPLPAAQVAAYKSPVLVVFKQPAVVVLIEIAPLLRIERAAGLVVAVPARVVVAR
jgi:hypothetical protein